MGTADVLNVSVAGASPAFTATMARVAASYPDDLDVATLYAEALFLLLPRVKNARYVLLPATGDTRGHGTHSLAALWKGHLTTFLLSLPRTSSP